MLRSRARVVERRDAAAPFGDRFGHRALEDRDEQVVLAPEVEVDGAGGDAGGAGDVGDLRIEIAAGGEGVDGGAQERVAFVAALGLGGERTARRATGRAMNECSFTDAATAISGRRLTQRAWSAGPGSANPLVRGALPSFWVKGAANWLGGAVSGPQWSNDFARPPDTPRPPSAADTRDASSVPRTGGLSRACSTRHSSRASSPG